MPKLKRQSHSQRVAQQRKLVQLRRASHATQHGASSEDNVAVTGPSTTNQSHELGIPSQQEHSTQKSSAGNVMPSSVLSAQTRSSPYNRNASQQKHGVSGKDELGTITQKEHSTRKRSDTVMPRSVLSAHTRSSAYSQGATQQIHAVSSKNNQTPELGTTSQKGHSTRKSSGKIMPSLVLSAYTRSSPYSRSATQQKHGVSDKDNQSPELGTTSQKEHSIRKSAGKVMLSPVLSDHTRFSPYSQSATQQKQGVSNKDNQSQGLGTTSQKGHSTRKISAKMMPSCSMLSAHTRYSPYSLSGTRQKHDVSNNNIQSHVLATTSQKGHGTRKHSGKIMPSSVLSAHTRFSPYSRSAIRQKHGISNNDDQSYELGTTSQKEHNTRKSSQNVNPFKQHALVHSQRVQNNDCKPHLSKSKYKTNTIEDAMKTNMSDYFDSQERKKEQRQRMLCPKRLGTMKRNITRKNILPHERYQPKTESSSVNKAPTCKTTAQRIKLTRDHKTAQQKVNDKLKAKGRKSSQRKYRSKTKIQCDKNKDAARKQTSRRARTLTQVATT